MMINSYPTYLYGIRTLDVDDFIQLLGKACVLKDTVFNIDKFITIMLFLATYRVLDNNLDKLNINELNIRPMLQINESEFNNEIMIYVLNNPDRLYVLLGLVKIATTELTYIKSKLLTPNVYTYAIELFMKAIGAVYDV